jgi:glycosyltransferase involved in cell wall biosynthesis
VRVCHFLQAIRLERGGVVRAVLDLATLTAARGTPVTVVTHDAQDRPAEWKPGEPGTPDVVTIGPWGPLMRLTRAQLRTFAEIIREQDVLHIHACWNPANTQLADIARRVGTPYVQSVHGMLDDWSMQQSTLKKKVFLAMGGYRTLRGARFVHCTAEAELTQAKKWFAPAEGIVVPLVFDLAPYRELPGPNAAREAFADALAGDETPSVLFLSRVHYKKGPDVFIRAMGLLKDRGVACRGLIAGTAEDPAYGDKMLELVKELGLTDRVHFLGMVTGDTKTSLYELADIFALPTSQENFGFVFPEALACRTPVIMTTGVDTHPELVASGGAITVDRTPGAFADAITELLGSPSRRGQMGEAGRRWVLEHLDPGVIAERFDRMYASACG